MKYMVSINCILYWVDQLNQEENLTYSGFNHHLFFSSTVSQFSKQVYCKNLSNMKSNFLLKNFLEVEYHFDLLHQVKVNSLTTTATTTITIVDHFL